MRSTQRRRLLARGLSPSCFLAGGTPPDARETISGGRKARSREIIPLPDVRAVLPNVLNCTALPPCIHPWVRRGQVRANVSVAGNFCSGMMTRKSMLGENKNIGPLPLRNFFLPLRTSLKGGWHDEGSNLRCHCFGALANPESLTPSKWVPVIDQVLLTVSIVLAYMGGVVPHKKTLFNSRKDTVEQEIGAEDSTSSGRGAERTLPLRGGGSWSTVGSKLIDGLKATENDDYLDRSVNDRDITNGSLSLFAVAEIDKMLKELCLGFLVGLIVLYQVFKCSFQGLLTETFKKLWEDNSVLDSFKGLGKSELYADLLYFLRFGSLRDGHIFGNNFLVEHGVDILEDLVVSLADGISSMYLELISIDSNVADEMNSLDLNLCRLSTRELQRIRNEVALRQWVLRNFQSVALMYEDRFDLCVLRTKYHERPVKRDVQENHWWQKFAYGKAESTLLCYVWIDRAPMRVKRTKELRALTGWRYYFSLFLELSDVAMPLFRVVFTKGREVVSFLLTCLVGRSLGLIYAGIRQSLGFR
ncbi:unnamed protein product [Spirodela intermedia]|uniref:Uncharacterized protein n=1 Tax=Spirodela intermedia TaxID=51605 RepID=A0A7I8K2J1_SPIIN|nr:unnamed protein product [Spirodela intermedia]